jgi:hypothetical protein
METETITYWLDTKDRISSIHGPWDKFADENDGVGVRACDVYGRSIWDYVTGDTTRMWLGAVFQLARLRGVRIERPYRCDSPDLKRFMRMHISPDEKGGLQIEHKMLNIEERISPIYIQHGSENVSKNLTLRCSFCGRVKQREAWLEPPSVHAITPCKIIVAYSVCEDCQQMMPQTKKSPIA